MKRHCLVFVIAGFLLISFGFSSWGQQGMMGYGYGYGPGMGVTGWGFMPQGLRFDQTLLVMMIPHHAHAMVGQALKFGQRREQDV